MCDLKKNLNLQKECKGKLFKATVSAFFNNKGEYIYQEKMIPLKRESCPDCEYCAWLMENITDVVDGHGGSIMMENPIINNSIYKLDAINESKDLETGIIDDWDLAFMLVENKNKE